MIMTSSKAQDENQLKSQALWLCQYILSNNEFRSEIDQKEIESLLEDDFINLEEFILKDL